MVVTAQTLDANVEAINLVRKALSADDLVKAGSYWAKANGFDHWIYGIGAPAQPRLLGTFPPAWIKSATTGETFSDPLLTAADKRRAPVVWDLQSRAGLPSLLTVTHNRLARELWEIGLRSGMTVPIIKDDHHAQCVFAVSNTHVVDPRVRYKQEPYAMVFALYFQQAIQRVLGNEVFTPQTPVLVPRELECLNWSSQGKTSAEIAMILGIAESTVNYHIANAARKFGVRGRLQAIQQAFRLRLLN